MPPVVSVVVTTYQHERWIEDALRSILAQNLDFDIEVLVGVDCSLDRTREIVEGWERRAADKLRGIYHSQRVGLLRNFVTTLSAAKGQYVALLEGDDYWCAPEKLHRQLAELAGRDHLSLCGHRVEQLTTEGEKRQPIPQLPFAPINAPETFVARDCDLHTSSLFFRHSLSDGAVGALLDERARVYDLPLKVMLAGKGSVAYLAATMSVFRRVPGSASADLYANFPDWRRAIVRGLENARPFVAGRVQGALDRKLAELCWDGAVEAGRPALERGAYAARALLRAPAHVARKSAEKCYSRLPKWQQRLLRGRQGRPLE